LRQSYRDLRREREFKIKKLKDYIPRKKPKNIQDELQEFHNDLSAIEERNTGI